MAEPELYAGIDLGSNSFHMIVARLEHGQFRIIDRIKDMVRLGGGLDDVGRLDEATRRRALEALARFGERIRDIPEHQVRAVGTQTFRRLSQPAAFLVVAETALGSAIDIVSGREEARLIWLGVSQGVAPAEGSRLVIDIGGGSTELVAGDSLVPTLAESLPLGCVSLTRWGFPDGALSEQRYERVLERCRAELQAWRAQFRSQGWNQAIGTSGTIRAIASMIESQRPGQDGQITRPALDELKERLLARSHCDALDLPGLSARRQPVIIGGLAALDAVMESLQIDIIRISPFALREGVLQDLMGRLGQQDPRDTTVGGMMARYQVDRAQAERVTDWTAAAFEQVRESWSLKPIHGELLHWISQLHEIGLSIAHDGHQHHTAYILQHADMPGFSRQEQEFMAVVAGLQRRKVDESEIDPLPDRLHAAARHSIALLRLAVTICRGRSESDFGDFCLCAQANRLTLALDEAWLSTRPLVRHDLAIEQQELSKLGFEFDIESLSHSPA